MDSKLRELERAVVSGGGEDPEARERWLREKMRSRNYYPLTFSFHKMVTGFRQGIASGREFNGYDHSSRLHFSGLEWRDCGPTLPVGGILRSVGVSVNYPGECDYTIEVCNVTTKGPGSDWKTIFAKSVLGAGVKASVDRKFYVEIPGAVPLGVRIGGDQSSTFSAICVTLEIWIPGS